MIQASDVTTGQAVFYSYDAVGNILSQQAVSLSTLAIAGFGQDRGVVGGQLTIYGSGFSTTPGANTVSFNGVVANVISATSTQLVVTIPAGATSGPITVTTGSSNASSGSTAFIIGPAANAPTISSFSPTFAAAGSSISLMGSGFNSNKANDKIEFNAAGPWSSVTAASSTNLAAVVASAGAWGKIRVLTPNGLGVSASDFFSPPTGYTVTSINTTGRIALNTPAALSLSTAGQSTLEIFDGTAGDYRTVGVSNDSLTSCTLKLFAPNGTLLASSTVTASGQGMQLPTLPLTGTYALIVDPGANTGALTLDLATPLTGVLTPGGTSLPLSLNPVGERAIATFTGTVGQYLTLGIGNNTVASTTITVYKPDGTQLVVGTAGTSTSGLQLPQLPAAGTYSIMVDPRNYSGNITLSLVTPITGSLTVGGSALPLYLTPTGQRALVTFSGTVGQYLTLEPDGIFTASTVKVFNPDGTQLTTASVTYSTASVQLPRLAATGTYTVLVDPGNSSGGESIKLVGSVMGSGNDGVLHFADSNARGVLTFTGTPGKYVAITLREGNQPDSISGIQVTVVAPDGTSLNSSAIMGPPPGEPSYSFFCQSNGYCYGNSIINLGPLPTYSAGTTYTVLIQQTGGYGGDLYYDITTPLASSQTLTVNGSSVQLYIATAGQGISIPVTLIGNQHQSVTIAETGRNIPFVEAVVLNAQGQAVQGAGLTATCASPCTLLGLNQYSGSESSGIGVNATGTYTILIQQVTQTSGANAYGPLQGDLWLSVTSP